tara:strand:- start:549 stop:803 length:255 start_codon:yes stop_codon:yes gene_type:complete
MVDTDKIISSSPAFDNKLQKGILHKLKDESNVLVFAFYIFSLFLILFLMLRNIDWEEALVIIFLILCLTFLIALSFLLGKKKSN